VPDERYESGLVALAQAALADATVRADLEDLRRDLRPSVVANTLGARALQLMLPGVPDIFQGAESTFLRLVDPDNRVTPDWRTLADGLDAALAEVPDPAAHLGRAKLRLTALGLQVRREHAESFGPGSSYVPADPRGPAAGHVIGFWRGPPSDPDRAVVAVTVTRWAASLAEQGGWRNTVVDLPAGRWKDLLTDTEHVVGAGSTPGVAVASLHARWPVALLVRPAGTLSAPHEISTERTR
jgi:(1->4)-alpha-D-glucan 1-alpha-D-glucosylmutase